MEISLYIQLFRRWWWLFTISALIFGSASFIQTQSSDSVYRASARLFVGSFTQDPNPSFSDITISTDLATTYATLVSTRPIRQGIVDALGPGTSLGTINAFATEESSLLTITVTHPSPVLAANVANEAANQLILASPTGPTAADQTRLDIIADEADQLTVEIGLLRNQISELDARIAENPDDEELANLRLERSDLSAQLLDTQRTLSIFSNTLAAFNSQTNTIRLVEPAIVPGAPLAKPIRRNTVIGTFVGIALAIVLVVVFEFFDDTFRGPEDVDDRLGVEVLAGIVRFGKRTDSYKNRLVMMNAPNSSPVQAYRALRTNIIFGQGEDYPRRMLVTSARMGEGKTVTGSNLAVSFAKYQMLTVLIDADFYRPQVHKMIDADNHIGLSTIFSSKLPEELYSAEELEMLMHDTDDPLFKVITSGPRPANPSELLGLPHLEVLCRSLEAYGVKMILFDTPPLLAVVDSIAIASVTKCRPLIVVQAQKTRRAMVNRVIEQLQQVDIEPLGIILNNITRQANAYYYYAYSYEEYVKPQNRLRLNRK